VSISMTSAAVYIYVAMEHSLSEKVMFRIKMKSPLRHTEGRGSKYSTRQVGNELIVSFP
jgi:hypothetical protein